MQRRAVRRQNEHQQVNSKRKYKAKKQKIDKWHKYCLDCPYPDCISRSYVCPYIKKIKELQKIYEGEELENKIKELHKKIKEEYYGRSTKSI